MSDEQQAGSHRIRILRTVIIVISSAVIDI
jgi:hypothetical protein